MSDGKYSASGQKSKAERNSAKEAWEQAPPFTIADNLHKLKIVVWEAQQCKTQLEAALLYASYGVPVIPCNWKPKKGETKIQQASAN